MDYAALRERMREIKLSQKEAARLSGMDECQLSRKLNGASGFSQEEILRLCEVLGIPSEEIGFYFFRRKEGDDDQ